MQKNRCKIVMINSAWYIIMGGGNLMRYIKPETEIVEFEGYVSTSDYEGLLNSNNTMDDVGLPNHGGSTDLGGEEW